MRKMILSAVTGGLVLVSVAAFAQMRPEAGPSGSTPGQALTPGHPMHGMMHGQGMMHGHGMPGMMGAPGIKPGVAHAGSVKGDDGPASLALNAINAKMHAAMSITLTGNADVDFVRTMIPHHQGAIDMAKLVLAFGKDLEIKKLAEAILKAQSEEISWMTDWLKKNSEE